jgi:hypothetical protein
MAKILVERSSSLLYTNTRINSPFPHPQKIEGSCSDLRRQMGMATL